MSQIADSKVARRYASALFAAAQKTGKIEAVQRDLAALTALWKQTPALAQVMESPLVPGERKHALIDQLFGKDLDALTQSFLRLLVDKRREEILETVAVEFNQQADAARGLVRAQATVAAPLDDRQRAALIAGLQQRTSSQQIELSVNVDPAILGGVIVRLQDTVIDGSVRGALERLREQLLLHER